MKHSDPLPKDNKIEEFILELSSFASVAETTLQEIEKDMEGKKTLFSIFEKKMFAIRGTAKQLQLNSIANIAGLGEEISIKAEHAINKAQVRRCVSSLWDVMSTVKYLLQHRNKETSEEQDILVHRLQNTLRILGGERPKISADEIDKILKNK